MTIKYIPAVGSLTLMSGSLFEPWETSTVVVSDEDIDPAKRRSEVYLKR